MSTFHADCHIAALAFSPVDPNILLSGCKSSAAGSIVALWDLTSELFFPVLVHLSSLTCRSHLGPKKSIAFFQIPGDVLHLAWHPSGKQFAVVSPRDPDEVIFYHQIIKDGAEEWELRDDIGMIAVKPDNANSAEVSYIPAAASSSRASLTDSAHRSTRSRSTTVAR